MLRKPHGMIVVTGPTGAGKTTTLYAALQTLNSDTININTIEDPVEYQLPGINQVQVNPRIGVTFASGLRTLVRQDPDVILVGEIRDAETAEIAIQAALTGHLVLSTLHTNDAPGALVRLQNMGIERFLISSSIVGVIAQRLVRVVCPTCRELYEAPDDVVRAFNLPLKDGKPPSIARGKGCTRCGERGMKGRTAIHEVMQVTDAQRELVLQGASADQLYTQALNDGMVGIHTIGARRILDHSATPEEVARVLSHEG